MPCRCDISDKEIEADLVAELLKYVYKEQDKCWVDGNNYKDLENNTILLCKLCKEIDDGPDDYIIYDGRNPTARKLADWWDTHKKNDYAREKRDREIAYTRLITDITLLAFNNAKVTHVMNDRVDVEVTCKKSYAGATVDNLEKWFVELHNNNIDPQNLKLEFNFE